MPLLENAHALVVGVADYRNIRKLPPVKDAQEIARVLTDPGACGYKPDHVRLLMDGEATRAALRQGLADLTGRCDPRSTVFIYFSGHGGRVEDGPHEGQYLLPVDTLYPTSQDLAATAISGTELTQALDQIPARRLVVVLDCCHAGGIGEVKDIVPAPLPPTPTEDLYEVLKSGQGRVILASSLSTEASYVPHGSEYGLFTRHLLAGLRGGAFGPGGVIRVFDLFDYVQKKVVQEQPGQNPLFKAEVRDNFPIALYRGGTAPALPASKPDGDFDYDVFISYRQKDPDRSWVRKTLLPQLEARGLRVCIDERDFMLGAPLIDEMERAVENSRYTLAVLTPAYLESTFTDYERGLAQHLGLEKRQRRFVAVMRERCTPRLGVRYRLWLDMTDDSEFPAALDRLVYQLKLPPDSKS